ncbi:MAG TPA: serpin family protein [Planctomycetota bacterium]|nr:serpin family protein [Planctomycetota bacterium]
MRRTLPVVLLAGVALAGDAPRFEKDLWGQIVKGEGNVVFSPYSVAEALALVKAGAKGTTRDEIEKLLPKDPEAVAAKQVKVANHIWGQKDKKWNAGFAIEPVDFRESAAARKAINAKIEEDTAGKIKDLLPEDAINADTRLVLANAIHMKAKWKQPFEKEITRDETFTLMDGTKVEVPTMREILSTKGVRHGKDANLSIVELPYDESTLVMDVIVPKDMAKYELDLDKALALLVDGRVRFYLPRFEATSDVNLKPVLEALGMKAAFRSGEADFSGFDGERDLHVSTAVTKTFVSVDEDGTEAAAATAFAMATGAANPDVPEVRADRPFVFAIRDTKTGAVLFLGRISKPEASKRR